MITHSKDTDLLILHKLSYDDILNISQVNKKIFEYSKDESVWKNLVWKEYNKIKPDENQTWKELYLKIRYQINTCNYRKDLGSFMASAYNNHHEVRKYLATLDKFDESYNCEYVMQRGKNAGMKCGLLVSYNKYERGSNRFCDFCLKKTVVQKILNIKQE